MDPTVIVAIIGASAVILSALVGWLTARHTTRSAEKSKKLEIEAAAYNRAKDIWNDVIDDLRTEVKDNRAEMQTLRSRVESLERGREEDQAKLRRAAAYINQLTKLLLGAGVVPPPSPSGLFDDNFIEDIE